MNRVLIILRGPLAETTVATDRDLLDRFLAARDEVAFAELVRRYGPVVWGACRRRLANVQDAEDAFQATFLVLLRRAARLDDTVPLGPWLYKVAVMTARNVVRGNRRRAAVTGPMEHEVAATGGEPSADHLDLDAALLTLPERDRVPVVLCHLQGLTRREAAERLGCPEGTLSARLNRALARLRSRLGGAVPAALAVAAVALPAGLASATVRSATIYSTSTLPAAGVSPAVAGLTDGVLRMFWMKKVMTVAAALLVTTGVLALLGLGGRPDSAAHAAPPAGVEDPETAKRFLEKRLADLEKERADVEAGLAKLKAEQKKLDDAKKEKEKEKEKAALAADTVLVTVINTGGGKFQYSVRELIDGKAGEMRCSDLDVLATYLTRARNDPKGPKNLRVSAAHDFSAEQVAKVFAACAKAGYKKATFGTVEYRVTELLATEALRSIEYTKKPRVIVTKAEPKPEIKPGEIDLLKFAEPKKQP